MKCLCRSNMAHYFPAVSKLIKKIKAAQGGWFKTHFIATREHIDFNVSDSRLFTFEC